MTLFCGWGLFTTKLMAMHWREVCREITDSAPRANLWATHQREIHLTFAATVGVDTAFVAVFASADGRHRSPLLSRTAPSSAAPLCACG